jgi:hypothetical protein
MALLFATAVVTLELLNFVSLRDNGFVTAAPGGHYFWTYGPVFGAPN